MADELALQEADKTFDQVQKESGYSKEEQIEGLRVLNDLGGKYLDLMKQQENSKMEERRIDLAYHNSTLAYNLAKDKLDCIKAVLLHHFSKEDEMIEKGFQEVDKAIEAGEWNAAVGFFGKMTEMVSKSPLAAAIEFNEKMKSGNLSLDDF